MDFRLVDITETPPLPETRVLTPEEEAAIIARCKAETDPLQLEAEFRDLFAQHERGELVDADELLRQIDADSK